MQLQAALHAGRVVAQHDVHDGEKLLDALVLPQVLPTFHQEGVISLIVPSDDQAFGTADGRHHHHLDDTVWGHFDV